MSRPGTTIVSAGDAKYFQLVRALVQSIHEHRPSDEIAICILDLGMEQAQLEELRRMVTQIVPGRWDFQFPMLQSSPRWYQAMTARPFLPQYFPGYERYIWLDSDTWLQDWRTIDLLLDHFIEDIAVVPEVHPIYPYLYGAGGAREIDFARTTESFGEPAARFLGARAIVNSGVFAAPAKSPFWEHYGQFVQAGCQRSANHWTEQYALNLALYKNLQIKVLPAWCNWVCCLAMPTFDPQRKCLCEPIRPFEKLSLIHLTRMNRPGAQILDTDENLIEMPIDYFGFKAALAH